jgi:hypothetical protein
MMEASVDHRFKRWLWVKHLFALARWERRCAQRVANDLANLPWQVCAGQP